MSKAGKRVKSGSGQHGGAKWEQALLAAPFEEDNWKPNITFVVGNKVEDYTHINILGASVASGTRKLFSIVPKEELYNEVRELGNPKSKKGKEVPAHYEVCEPCKVHLDNDEDIPLPLLAKLLKFKLLAIRTSDIKRREHERKADHKSEAAADKDKGGKKDKGKDRSKSPGKKGGKKTPEPQSAKEGSKLKKRGEDDQESKYIDDEPNDGAQHYIIIIGFHNPHIFGQLAEIGINVDCIICLRSQDYSRFEMPASDTSTSDKDEKTLALEEAAREEKLRLKNEIQNFWRDILILLQRNPDSSKLHDVARLEYEVKNLLVPTNLEDPEQKTVFGTTLFEDVAVMIYDLIDAHRLYHTYLENLKLLHIPVHGQVSSAAPGQDGVSTGSATPAAQMAPTTSLASFAAAECHADTAPPVDMRYYNDLMNSIPQESVSVPLMLHSMLEQVVASEENKDPPSEQQPAPRTDGLNIELASHLSTVAFKLALTEDEHKSLSEVFDLPERPPDTPRQPLLMNFHDDITIRTHKLETVYGFSPIETEKMMLKHLSSSKLLSLPRPTSAVARERAARLQELIHFCATGAMSQSEIDRALKQFVFESMDLTSTDSNGFLVTCETEGIEHSAIPWDDPYPFFKGMIPHHEKPSAPKLPYIPSPSDDQRSGCRSPTPDDHAQSVEFSEFSTRKDGEGSPDRSRPSTAESKKGILRSQSRSASPEKQSRSNSVHFEIDESQPLLPGEPNDEEENVATAEEEKSVHDSLMEIVDAQRRNLDQWCFAEHFEPHILLQVLKEASYTLPFMDTYYHKRDNSLLVCLHTPYNQEFQNHVDWHTELHSNLGFRNYLEYVSESVADWLKEKEAEYQAHVLSQEVEKIRHDEENAAKAAEKATKGRTKSPSKARSRSKSPKGSRSSSLDRPSSASSNPFVRTGSLKAWKEEQDRIKAEEEEKEKLKSEKRSKSPKKQQQEEDKEKDKKRPGSRGSAKSKISQKDVQENQEVIAAEPQEEEKYWPFTGYDLGNQLVHASGIVTSLFPSDGGQIRTERTEYVQGTTSVVMSVLKDGHVFSVHILNPKEGPQENSEDEELDPQAEKKDEPEKSEFEKSEKEEMKPEKKDETTERPRSQEKNFPQKSVSGFGSITAHLVDGMTLALSQFGPDGEAEDGKKYEPEPYVAPPSSPSPLPQVSKDSPSKGKKEKGKGAATPEPAPVQKEDDEIQEEEKKEEEPSPSQPFQQLFISCPDGLNVRYFLESSVGVKPSSADDRHLVVKQCYPFKTKGLQPCEATRKKYALREQSRIITGDGTVIKTMMDCSVEVLYADGTVSKHTGTWPLSSSRSSSPQCVGSARSQGDRDTPTKKTTGRSTGKPGSKSQSPDKLGEFQAHEDTEKKGTWVTTYPSGEQMAVHADRTVEDLKPVMICIASDPETRQSMSTRDDHVITVSYPDGTTIVEHWDGTRITTYYRDRQVPMSEDDTMETGEAPQYENRTIKFVKVECPSYATVEFNCSTSENLTVFGNGTSINVFPDGFYSINHAKGGHIEVNTEGTLIYYPRPNKHMEQLLPAQEMQYVLRHNADIICETVDNDGNVFNVKHTGDFAVIPASGDEMMSTESIEENKQEKKIVQYSQHAPRFFIIHNDGSGTELMRYQDVAEYLVAAELSPATAVLKDPIPEYPGVMGITVLKPYIGGPSDRWLKKYDLQSIIPHGIRSRDLSNMPAREIQKAGPQFGTNVGQGLAVGAAIKSPTRIPILKCPNVLELRQIVQYKPVTESLRSTLQSGLREYAEYVMARNQASEMMKVIDQRSEEEKILAADLQSTALLQKREQPQLEPADIKDIYEKATAPPVPTPPPTPQAKRTQADWERDQREIAEELEGRAALRNKKIPSYFESELGKAFLLSQAKDMDQMVRELSEDPRRDGTEAVRADTSSLSYPQDGQSPLNGQQVRSQVRNSQQSDHSSIPASPLIYGNKVVMETPISYTGFVSDATMTPSGLRPGNPTPAHATGQGSPSPLRPKNPTPAHAGKVFHDRPGNPTPKVASGMVDSPSGSDNLYQKSDYPVIQESEEDCGLRDLRGNDSDLVLTRSLKVNVIGEPRQQAVPLPRAILGGRPGAFPNRQFRDVEDPVRRQVNNSVVAGATVMGKSQLTQMRGLNLIPEEVDFGVLKEGNTYSYSVFLRNTGIDTCRFKVKQPPPATGLRVIYNPGPVAAGMKAELKLELYAIAVGVEGDSGVGTISHELIIVSETDFLRLPISATVLTSHEYDHRNDGSPMGGKSVGTRLLSTKPPSTTGIIRPRRDQMMENVSG